MRRREFIGGIGAAAAWPLAASAQQPTNRPLVAYLAAMTEPVTAPLTDASLNDPKAPPQQEELESCCRPQHFSASGGRSQP